VSAYNALSSAAGESYSRARSALPQIACQLQRSLYSRGTERSARCSKAERTDAAKFSGEMNVDILATHPDASPAARSVSFRSTRRRQFAEVIAVEASEAPAAGSAVAPELAAPTADRRGPSSSQ
jgi:hypothetical protein